MFLTSLNPIACLGVGTNLTNSSCCYASDLNSTACHGIFSGTKNTLSQGCNSSSDCISDCANKTLLYTSLVQDDPGNGNGKGPVTRYQACVNLPSIVRHSQSDQLSQAFVTEFEKYTTPNTTDLQLQELTSTITDCLSSTCRNSRRPDLCYDDFCSPVRLLTNSSSPNVIAIDQCLNTLCDGGFKSLPFADADIVGIGVGFRRCNFVIIHSAIIPCSTSGNRTSLSLKSTPNRDQHR